jgi:hypothetical protein
VNPNNNESEALTLEALAAQMLGLENNDAEAVEAEEEVEEFTGHPAWKDILDVVPAEHRGQVQSKLAEWDAGVSRRFQKIHDEYAPYKALEDYDPDTLKTAAEVYDALLSNPKDTWETIGRVYGLSPQQVSDIADEIEDDDYELPASVRNKLSKLDEHERILGMVTQREMDRQAAEEQAQEDAALEEYLEELAEEYGEFDEDYVIGLIAAGVDGDEAVERYQQIIASHTQQSTSAATATPRVTAPTVMSGSGGIPTSGSVNVSKLNNQDTQALVAEMLRLAASE